MVQRVLEVDDRYCLELKGLVKLFLVNWSATDLFLPSVSRCAHSNMG